MKHVTKPLIILSILATFLLTFSANAQDDTDVKAVLFYSPTCGHCHLVIEETLPPLWQEYGGSIEFYKSPTANEDQGPPFVAFLGDRLSILYVDISTPDGSLFFKEALDTFDLPESEGYVPTLFVGDTRLVGSGDIPAQFPGIVENGLEQGGIDWPALPGLEQIISGLELDSIQEVPTPADAKTAGTENVDGIDDNTGTSIGDRFKRDVLGNSISVVVLLGMLVSLGFVMAIWRNQSDQRKPAPMHWIILPLLILGIVIAGYLAYVENSGTEAVCGPVGDCNTVQNSSYAVFLGIIPIGTLGIIGYIAILIAWAITRIYATQSITDYALLAIFAMAILGTLFSIYLTFLEPFVIGATCIWCLTSAILMTAIMLLSVNPAARAYARIRNPKKRR